MADQTIQISGLATAAAPVDYKATGTQSLEVVAVRAVWDGTAAGSSWKPCVQLLSAAGSVMSQTTSDTVAAATSADVTFYPFRRRISGAASTRTYAQVVATIAATHTLVAEWKLGDGAAPYLDTSNFAPADPANLSIQASGTAMTQNYTPGALAGAQDDGAVAFNFDGTAATGSGDALTDTLANPSRYYFLGTLPFTVVLWVLPFGGAVARNAAILGNVHISGSGVPTATIDGWQLDINYPGLDVGLSRGSGGLANNPMPTARSAALPLVSWSMIAGTYDGATIRLYVNGALVSSTADAGNIGSSANAIHIGRGPTGQNAIQSYFYGAADMGDIFVGALTGAQIAQLYAAGITT